jgi:8-oxo-dGTP pyrophosphatase MutT (NUDIX family)
VSPIQESGAIVFRPDADAPRVLLVTAKRNPSHWIFPKGHIEPGESAPRAALREAREEAGVIGKIIAPAGTTEYQLLGDTIHVQYFLIELEREEDPAEAGRSRLWCRLEEALERLTFEDTRELLRDAWIRLPAAPDR